MKKSEQRVINSKVEYELEHYNGITAQLEIKEIGCYVSDRHMCTKQLSIMFYGHIIL